MNRIIKIGMDVHTSNYTLCIFEPSFEHDGTVHCITQIKPEVKNIIHVIETFKKKHENEELNIVCGYEAGCLGYSLYHELKEKGIECVILAPTTMKTEKGGRKLKNDYRDAKMIAECLAYGGYSAVHIPLLMILLQFVYPKSLHDHINDYIQSYILSRYLEVMVH